MTRSIFAAALLLPLGTSAALAGPPIQLASPPSFAFTGRSLVVADFDGVIGRDLAGVNGASVKIAPRQLDGSFGAEQSFAMGVAVEALRTADLDGDARLDLVAAAYGARALVTRLNLGGLAFAPAVQIPTGGNARDLAIADLNGDERPDAVTALYDSAEVAVSLNDGAGNLLAPFRLAALPLTSFVEVGDFTGDAVPDIAAVTVGCGSPGACPSVMVFAGQGDGTFDPPQTTSFGVSYRLSTASGDFNEDGALDLVLFCGNTVLLLVSRGDGTFDPPVSVGMPNASYDTHGAEQFAVGDVDQDGHLDLAIPAYLSSAWQSTNMLSIVTGHGDGTFDPPVHHHVGQYPKDAALADLDGDGWLDAVATTHRVEECCFSPSSSEARFAWVLRNSGVGTFDAHVEVFANVWMPARRTDGPADLVGTSAGRLTRTRNRGHGTFLGVEDLGRGAPWRAVDLDGNGNDELIVTSGDSLWVLLGTAPGVYGAPSSIHTGLRPRDVADFDADGKLDLLVTDAAHNVNVVPGDGAGGLGAPVDYGFTTEDSPYEDDLRAGDLDGDGRADLVRAREIPELVSGGSPSTYRAWLLTARNDGEGHFTPADSFDITFTSTIGPGRVGPLALADFDGDGALDAQVLSYACGSDNRRWWGTFRGLGAGAFSAVGTGVEAGNSACDLAAADLNGDGLADLVRTNGNGGFTMRASTFTASGGGLFTPSALGDMGDYPGEVFLADMDGDGKLDVVTRASRTHTGSIRRNVTPYVVTPAQLALVAAWIEDGAAWLDWHSPDGAMSAMLERRTEASGWSLLAPVRFDGTGSLRYVDRALPAGSRVGYRLRWSDADGVHVTAETWLDVGMTAFALRGAWPNPASATPAFAIVLPQAGTATLEVFDLGGRRVAHQRRAELAAGPQRLALASARLSPGVYVARLTFAGRRLESRFVVLE